MLDPDVARFMQGLNQTGPGLRLRLAMHEGRVAWEQIQRLRHLGGKPSVLCAIQTWRRAYIRACENATDAIDELFEKHAWPTDGARVRDYQFNPPAWQSKRSR